MNALTIGLVVVLLLAICLLVFGVGKIVYGIAHYYLRERKPERQFRHPEFGVLTSSNDSLWTGAVQRDGRRICLLVGGTESAPSERLLSQVQGILKRFVELEGRAIEFLRSREAEVRGAKLDFYTIEVADEQGPDNFTFEFLEDTRDYSRIWRVEFISGEPKHTGFDD